MLEGRSNQSQLRVQIQSQLIELLAGHEIGLLQVDQPPQACGKIEDKLQMLDQDRWIEMMDEPAAKVKVELDFMMMNILHHLPKNYQNNLRGRVEAERQRMELIGLCQRHHRVGKILVLQIDGHMEICVCQVNRH